jgi:hypothetical protein
VVTPHRSTQIWGPFGPSSSLKVRHLNILVRSRGGRVGDGLGACCHTGDSNLMGNTTLDTSFNVVVYQRQEYKQPFLKSNRGLVS